MKLNICKNILVMKVGTVGSLSVFSAFVSLLSCNLTANMFPLS